MMRQPRLVSDHEVPLVPGICPRFLRRRCRVALGRDLPAIRSPAATAPRSVERDAGRLTRAASERHWPIHPGWGRLL
jgi:hypothetical protein